MTKTPKSVENITHEGDKRANIPTAEYENMMRDEDKKPIELEIPRNLIWIHSSFGAVKMIKTGQIWWLPLTTLYSGKN